MAGRDGARGYLLQAVVAVLESLDDPSWVVVALEPDEAAQKVDIEWAYERSRKHVQVKSSKNQISKAEALQWATELGSESTANTKELLLIGPCAQSVLELGEVDGVAIPAPRVLDHAGLLSTCAHRISQFCATVGINEGTSVQREQAAQALVAKALEISTTGDPLTRDDLTSLLESWIAPLTKGIAAWEKVAFEPSRGIESAIAGRRLGPLDAKACPRAAAVTSIISDLRNAHSCEVVGAPGSGKSIAVWQAARELTTQGMEVWRPRTGATADLLLEQLPTSGKNALVVDDAQEYGPQLTARLFEQASVDRNILVATTIEASQTLDTVGIVPSEAVDAIYDDLANRTDEVLQIVRKYDERVGDGFLDTPIELRLSNCRKEKTPWGFFFVLRGGWQRTRMEVKTAEAFEHAVDALLVVAVGQIVSKDAGVDAEWIAEQGETLGIPSSTLLVAVDQLVKLHLVRSTGRYRTKHLQFAYQAIECILEKGASASWPIHSRMVGDVLNQSGHSLQGIAWLLEGLAYSWLPTEVTRTTWLEVANRLKKRCLAASENDEWAVVCYARLLSLTAASFDERIEDAQIVRSWVTRRSPLVAEYASRLISCIQQDSLQLHSPDFECPEATAFAEQIDFDGLAKNVNESEAGELRSLGNLLSSIAWCLPSWRASFLRLLDLDRLESMFKTLGPDRVWGVASLVKGLSAMAYNESSEVPSTAYAELATPFFIRSADEDVNRTFAALDSKLFMEVLGMPPKFLRGGRTPTQQQVAVAREISMGVSIESVARAMETHRPADMERLGRAFSVFQEADPSFVSRLESVIDEEAFLRATADLWRDQTHELISILRFFTRGTDLRPCSQWVAAQAAVIEGPLHPFFVAILPEMAVERHRSGTKIKLLEKHRRDWYLAGYALARLGDTDKAVCEEVIEEEIPALSKGLASVHHDEGGWILRLWRLIDQIAPRLIEPLVAAIDLDSDSAKQAIRQSARGGREGRTLDALVRAGRRATGPIADLAARVDQLLAEEKRLHAEKAD